MGLGLATLKSSAGNAVISIPGNVSDVRIAGPFIFEAGSVAADVLVEWKAGDDSASIGGVMHDAFFRVGGPDRVPVSPPVCCKCTATMLSGTICGCGERIIPSTALCRLDKILARTDLLSLATV